MQANLKRPGPPGSGPQDQSDLQAPVENNDVTFQVVDPSYQTVGGNVGGAVKNNGTAGVSSIVFPSVKNKPIADASALDGADALLTGVRDLKCVLKTIIIYFSSLSRSLDSHITFYVLFYPDSLVKLDHPVPS